MRYYSKELSIENQYLLWMVYTRPYYLYIAPVIGTQTKTIQNEFHSNWRISFKNFIGIPKNAPNEFVKILMEDTEEITKEMTLSNEKKINARFKLGYALDE